MTVVTNKWRRHIHASGLVFALTSLAFSAVLKMPSPACADISTLGRIIAAFNLECHEKSISDGSYAGEAGILRIKPEVAHAYGLKALMDENYIEAVGLLNKAEVYLDQTLASLKARGGGTGEAYHIKKVCEYAALYNQSLQSAQASFAIYRNKLIQELDDRLDRHRCATLMEDLLNLSLEKTDYNLRDALGMFYNWCHNVSENEAPLNVESVRFVNHVFREYTRQEKDVTLRQFDLDRQNSEYGSDLNDQWWHVLEKDAAAYVGFFESVLKNKGSAPLVDPLLFFALVRQESAFDPQAISPVGAAGLTQIMPSTAKGLGMKRVFIPPYLKEARSLMGRERRLRNEAMRLVKNIAKCKTKGGAARARELMQRSLDCRAKWKKLYGRYLRELPTRNDDRLDPAVAIAHGYTYLAAMLKMQKGDISLALASYNAGPHRVKNYHGIPPFAETVSFRNGVLKYYREYLDKLKRDKPKPP